MGCTLGKIGIFGSNKTKGKPEEVKETGNNVQTLAKKEQTSVTLTEADGDGSQVAAEGIVLDSDRRRKKKESSEEQGGSRRHHRHSAGGGGQTKSERRNTRNELRIRSFPRGVYGEQVAAGWPSWLSAVAGDAINGWIPRRADAFEKIDKVIKTRN